MEKALAVANAFINFALAENIEVTNMKLQKLVFFAHGWYMGNTSKALIEESFKVWKWGPVIPSLYHRFRDYGSNNITSIGFSYSLEKVEHGYIFKKETPFLKNPTEIMPFLKDVWDVYKNYTAIQLSNITHYEGSPWYTTAQQGLETIDNKTICNYYKEKLKR